MQRASNNIPSPKDEKRSSTSTPPIKSPAVASKPAPFTRTFFSPESAGARAVYLKIVVGGCFFIVVAIFAVFSIYWGSLWKTPVRNLDGWIVDFDNALVGQTITNALTQPSPLSKITWSVVPASRFPGGDTELANAVVEQKIWVALAVNANATANLTASYANPDRTYNGSQAITVYAVEARNENAFRVLIRPSVQAQLGIVTQRFAQEAVAPLLANSTGGNAASITNILATSPQTILAPIGYTVNNLLPFDSPVASAVTFVGLIYQLILSFFIVMIGIAAREASGLNKSLTLRSLIIVRLVSAFVAYFFIALFYALLSLAFQLDFSRKFGHAGFVIFWMLNWAGMLSVGLAIESLITLLTTRFVPFFMIIWIIVNVSVCIFPIEVMPIVFRYGYATPFYNVSHAVRCIVFGTKNTVGVNFAILIAWTAISCITLPLVQWYVRRQDVLAAQAQAPVVGEAPTGDSAHTVTLGRAAGSTGSLRRVSTDRNPQDSDSRDETLPMSSQSQFSRTRSVDGERGV